MIERVEVRETRQVDPEGRPLPFSLGAQLRLLTAKTYLIGRGYTVVRFASETGEQVIGTKHYSFE